MRWMVTRSNHAAEATRSIPGRRDRLIPNPAHDPPAAATLSLYLTKIFDRRGGMTPIGTITY